MDNFGLLALALVPGLLLLAFILFMDRNEKEPLPLVVKLLALGALSVIPAALAEYLLEYLPIFGGTQLEQALTKAFFQASLVEESVKLAVVLLFAWKSKHFSEENDGIVYTGAVALGFAMIENVLYVSSHGFSVGVMRGLTAVPLHCFTGVLMGYYVGRARFAANKGQGRRRIALGFFMAFLVHGLYDTFVFTRTSAALLIFPLVIILVVFALRLMRKGRGRSLARTAPESREPGLPPVGPPKRQRWKIYISRPLFILSALFWLILLLAPGETGTEGMTLLNMIVGAVILTFIPILIALLLEVSYHHNKKKLKQYAAALQSRPA